MNNNKIITVGASGYLGKPLFSSALSKSGRYGTSSTDADGSLVFTDFGWDVLKEMQAAGFSDVSVEVYASAGFGHLGGGQIIFRLIK